MRPMAQGKGRLAGKVAIVTGGTSGMGEATVERYVAEGARVMIAGRREDAGNAIVARLGADAAFTRTDVTREAEVERLVAATVERWVGSTSCSTTPAPATPTVWSRISTPKSSWLTCGRWWAPASSRSSTWGRS